jgi:hypothetical protein
VSSTRFSNEASSFSCGDTCPCPPATSNSFLTPGSSVGPMGGTGQFSAMEQRQDCRGTVFGPYNRTSDSTWSSSDTSVFTVSSGLVSCLQPGNGTVTAQFQATVYGQFCAPIYVTQRPSGPVAVKPKITSLSPARGVQGIEYNLTITGMGFKDPASVSVAGTGITVSGTQVGSSTAIITTFTIASDATGGNHAVTVTVSNQTSDGVNFYVQIPTQLVRQGDIGNLTDQQNGCGATRSINYELVDQAGLIIATDLTVNEVLSNITKSDPGISDPQPTSPQTDAGSLVDTLGYLIPSCPPPFTVSFSQAFKVTIGQQTYNLSNSYSISYGRDAQGNKFVNIQ